MSPNITVLRDARHKELARLYMALQQEMTDTDITKHVFEAIRNESLPPTVAGTWLTVSQSNEALAQALRQDYSCLVRKFAIKEFGRKMRKSSWVDIWKILGGIDGMIALFAGFSVLEVKQVATVIGHCSKGQQRPKREQCVQELLRNLVPFYHTDSSSKSTDERPLLQHYARMVPACSSAFVEDILKQPDNPLLPRLNIGHIMRYHPILAQQSVLESISIDQMDDDDLFWFHWPRLISDIPAGTRDSSGFSPTMQFSLKILGDLAEDPDAGLPPTVAMGLVAGPLLAHAIKNKVAAKKIQEIARTILKYIERTPKAAEYLLNVTSWRYELPGIWQWNLPSPANSVLFNFTRYWSLSGAAADTETDDMLTQYVSLYATVPNHKDITSLFEALYPAASRNHRFGLLRLVIKCLSKPSVDVDDLEQLRSLSTEKWSINIFTAMKSCDAIPLLERLLRVGRRSDFLSIEWGTNSILSCSVKLGGRTIDLGLLRTYLNSGKLEGINQTEQKIDEIKKKSATCRDQAERAFFAKSAMFYAIASGSLRLYGEVVQWSRRYIRDPLTAKTIYGIESILTKEGVDLLSGININEYGCPTPNVHGWRVAEANQILIELFRIACYALSEPSFHVHDWSAIKSIHRLVVERRMELTSLAQKRSDISEEVLYDAVWKGTIDTLLELEKTGCKPENERLLFNFTSGPLSQSRLSFPPTARPIAYSPASYRFLDRLAQARDELWREIRPLNHPAVVSLPWPWPQGLPIQCFNTPFDVGVIEAQGLTPFISSRATAILFVSETYAKASLPIKEETRAAIGRYVDSYDIALQIHVKQQPKGRARDERIIQAWKHAVSSLVDQRPKSLNYSRGVLSKPLKSQKDQRMDEQEAMRNWRSRFENALPGLCAILPSLQEESHVYPVISWPDEINEAWEWDPASNQPPAAKPRLLPVTVVDCMLDAGTGPVDPSKPFEEPQPKTLPFIPQRIWDASNIRRDCAGAEEGMIASAMLYIDSTENRAARILASPFPSPDSARYPPLILESDFLLREELSCVQAIEALRKLIDRVPSKLLIALATGVLSTSSMATDSEGNPTASPTACQLIILLGKCDRPQVTSDLIISTIIDHPETSSWHRQFLTSTLLSRLSPSEAREMVQRFAKAIEAKLVKQVSSGPPDDRAQIPLVKVTTVKYLAQLLREASFVTPKDSLEILASLFQKITHIDIRIAIVESLLAMLTEHAAFENHALTEQIMKVLGAVVPIMGRLTESVNFEENHWATLKKNDILPGVEGEDTTPPLFGLLLGSATDTRLPESVRRDLIRNIVLPAFELCGATHQQWIKLFLKRNSAPEILDELASVPPRLTVVAAMFRSIPDMLPLEHFAEWQRCVKANVTPSPELSKLNQKLVDESKSEDSESAALPRDREANCHWLQLFNQGTKILERFSLADLLRKERISASSRFSKQKISLLQSLVLEQADMILEDFERLQSSWMNFLGHLRRGLFADRDYDQTWYNHCRPILESIIERIEFHRNRPDRRDDQNCKPRFLPSTFDVRLLLLPVFGENDHEEFCTAVVNLVQEILDTGRPYHHDLHRIKNDALVSQPHPAQVSVACSLGKLALFDGSRDPSLMDYLRMDMAHWLLRKNERTIRETPERLEKSEKLLAQWRCSSVEEFRLRGYIGFEKATWGPFD